MRKSALLRHGESKRGGPGHKVGKYCICTDFWIDRLFNRFLERKDIRYKIDCKK